MLFFCYGSLCRYEMLFFCYGSLCRCEMLFFCYGCSCRFRAPADDIILRQRLIFPLQRESSI
ncbi:MAG: hypothetical protein BM485_03315 [Desulfobulbaceae bacterium DB1]|nr:MAG: hypothetical protein BM485_03315 [Desulfobulbaceae bacterium DB1]